MESRKQSFDGEAVLLSGNTVNRLSLDQRSMTFFWA